MRTGYELRTKVYGDNGEENGNYRNYRDYIDYIGFWGGPFPGYTSNLVQGSYEDLADRV